MTSLSVAEFAVLCRLPEAEILALVRAGTLAGAYFDLEDGDWRIRKPLVIASRVKGFARLVAAGMLRAGKLTPGEGLFVREFPLDARTLRQAREAAVMLRLALGSCESPRLPIMDARVHDVFWADLLDVLDVIVAWASESLGAEQNG